MQPVYQIAKPTPLQQYVADCAERMEAAYQTCKTANQSLSAAIDAHQPEDLLRELSTAHEDAQQAWRDTCRLYLQARTVLVQYEGIPA